MSRFARIDSVFRTGRIFERTYWAAVCINSTESIIEPKTELHFFFRCVSLAACFTSCLCGHDGRERLSLPHFGRPICILLGRVNPSVASMFLFFFLMYVWQWQGKLGSFHQFSVSSDGWKDLASFRDFMHEDNKQSALNQGRRANKATRAQINLIGIRPG